MHCFLSFLWKLLRNSMAQFLAHPPVDHPMIAWTQSELVVGDLMLSALGAWFFGSVDSPRADAGSPDAEASLLPWPYYTIFFA